MNSLLNSKIINVLFLIERLSNGGQQSYMYNILKESKELKINTVFFIDGAMRENYKEISNRIIKIDQESMSLRYYLKNPLSFLKVLFKLRGIKTNNQVDIVITNGFMSYLFGCMLKTVTKIKVVRFIGCDLVRNESFHFVKRFNTVPLHKLTDLFFGWDNILNQMKEKGVDITKLAYSLGNKQAVDTKLFYPLENDETRSIEDKYRLNRAENIIIGWHGRVDRDKEIFHTINMLKCLKAKNFDNYKFLIVGDGQSLENVFFELKSNNIFQHLVFVGMKPYKAMNIYYNIADVEVLLDRDPVGGSHVREAMACGKIVITTNGDSRFQSTWIENGENGYLVTPENMYEEAAEIIIELHNNREIIKTVGLKSRKYAEKYMSFKALAKIFESECKLLLNRQL